jgi:hypothetical protein
MTDIGGSLSFYLTHVFYSEVLKEKLVSIFPQDRADGMVIILVRTRLCFGPNLSPMILIGLTLLPNYD